MGLPGLLARAQVEIEERCLDFFSPQQVDEVSVEQLHIEGAQRLEVGLAFLVPRRA